MLADSKSTSGIDSRSKILEAVNGVAITSGALVDMKRDEGRALLREHRVVYIYHNAIDSVGDSANTESETFPATRKAIDQLTDLVRHIINSLNGTNILITSDHGFLFEMSAPDATDRPTVVEKPSGALIAKKRYILAAISESLRTS